MILWRRDPFGFTRQFFHCGGNASGESLRAVLSECPKEHWAIDVQAVAGYRSGRRLRGRTVVRGVYEVPPGHVLLRSAQGLCTREDLITPARARLDELLGAALRVALERGRRVALALSGGLDSALLLALLRALGAQEVPVYILAAEIPGYGELPEALDSAQRLGVTPIVVRVDAQAFTCALPQAMAHIQEPLYNLHPVAKLLLAQAMRRDGIEWAISGDGADQVLGRDRSADYLPLARVLFSAAGVTLHAPFLDPAVVAHLLSYPPDPDKRCLRELAARYGVPSRLVAGPKRRTMTPPLPLGGLLDAERIGALAQRLGEAPPALTDDAERVHWATLLAVLDALGVVD